jgi:hypothetical protein
MGLFNSTVLDVAIGLAFIYLLLAIICTAANEWIAGLLKARAQTLRQGIVQLLDDQETPANNRNDALLTEFYNHPLIKSMMFRGNTHPAYLSSKTFTAAILDILNPNDRVHTFEDLQQAVNALPPGDVQKTLVALLRRTDGDIETAERAIEQWYDDAMERVTGWYKRRTLVWTILVATAIVIFSNADTLQIGQKLWTDPVLRAQVVAEAQNRAKKPPPKVEYPNPDEPDNPQVQGGNDVSPEEQKVLAQAIGWHENPFKPFSLVAWLGRLLGWLLTILAVSLGAPFWFDLLNKFINIRSAGKSPKEQPKAPEKPAPPKRPRKRGGTK